MRPKSLTSIPCHSQSNEIRFQCSNFELYFQSLPKTSHIVRAIAQSSSNLFLTHRLTWSGDNGRKKSKKWLSESVQLSRPHHIHTCLQQFPNHLRRIAAGTILTIDKEMTDDRSKSKLLTTDYGWMWRSIETLFFNGCPRSKSVMLASVVVAIDSRALRVKNAWCAVMNTFGNDCSSWKVSS
jgi:hypothetical protein